ncbi:MAG TPA: amidohydrolase [Thermoanaerobaculia bacterium]|nr:amidohydrolase [Thermoanaerobaculia bacterium]
MKSIVLAFFVTTSALAQSIDSMIDRELPALVDTYKAFHVAPELSKQEEKTSATVAARLRALGYTVADHVGKYEDAGSTCYGVVAMMKNGDGPVLLVRTDMDALPVPEKTGVPYASQNANVMHACGHDIHMTTLLGTASMLAQLKSRWHGTVMLVGQPAEEVVQGASAMIRDRLYERFPRPSFAIALHDNASMAAGRIGYCPGYFMSNSDSVNIMVRGLGGHGASPQSTKDPIVVASEVVLALQTIVSRENSPLDPVVVTVGAIHGGAKRNVIPDQVELLLTVRTYKPEVRQRVLESIGRITRGIALAAGIPVDRAPIIEVQKSESAEATYNDPALTERLARALKRDMGADNVVQIDPLMVSEDFGRFGLERQIPICMLNVGAVDPAKIASGARLPSLHSSEFTPLPEPTIRGGVKAMTLAVLELLR